MSELTREQVDKVFLGLFNEQGIKGHIGITTTLTLLLAHDAALRARLEALEQERDAQTERQLELLDERNGLIGELAAIQTTVGDTEFALRARVVELERELEKKQALLLRSCQDNIEDYKVQCKPKCDSYGHEDDCPAAYPGLVYDEMRQQLTAREAECDEKSLEIIKLRHEVWDCIGQRDELHEVCKYHEKLEADMLEKLTAREETIRALEARWVPIEAAARKTFELESLPILLNGGTTGQERLAQIIARWHTAESLCAKLQATLTARENELCTAKDQIPPDMEEDSLSVALIKLKDKLAALEPELEKRKLMQERSIAGECEAEQHLMDAGISDYEDGEHGEYRGLLTQIDVCIKERDAAVQEAGRLKEALTLAMDELRNIMSVNVREWDDPTDSAFRAWAQSRARHTYGKAQQAGGSSGGSANHYGAGT